MSPSLTLTAILLLSLTLSPSLAKTPEPKPGPTPKPAPSATHHVYGTFTIKKSEPSFKADNLKISLYQYHPLIADKPADLFDHIIINAPKHTKGKTTTFSFKLAQKSKKKINPKMKYYLTAFIHKNGKRFYIGEINGKRGINKVLTNKKPTPTKLLARKIK